MMKSAVIVPEVTLDNPPDQLAEMGRTITWLTQGNRLLKEKINYLLHHRFGPKSERFTGQQSLLFGDVDTDINEAPKEEPVLVPGHVRPVAVGRKNWLFCQSQAGAKATAIWYSIVSTASWSMQGRGGVLPASPQLRLPQSLRFSAPRALPRREIVTT